MNDMFRGYDLSAVIETVAEKEFDRRREGAMKSGYSPDALPTWAQIPPVARHGFKASILPLVTDILDALEGAKPEVKRMVFYDYLNNDRSDPRWYENQHPEQHDVKTATVWALHINLHASCKDAVLERLALVPEVTGEYTYGDSWGQWGEEVEGDDDGHMVIYFHSPPEQATFIGYHLANHVTFAAMKKLGGDSATIPAHAVSTAGDYAEQIPNLWETL